MSVIFKIRPSIINEVRSCMAQEMKYGGSEYFTADFIAWRTGHSKQDVTDCLEAWPHVFRKSFIKSDNGEDVYMLERKFGVLIDAWKSFRHLSYEKYCQ